MKTLWTDALKRRKGTAKHMVHARKRARSLYWRDISRLRYHTDNGMVSPFGRADIAKIVLSVIEASRAKMDSVLHFDNGIGQAKGIRLFFVQNPLRNSLGGFRTHPRKALEFVKQLLYCR